MSETSSGEVIVYDGDDGAPGLEVRLSGETVWLSQQQLAELFQTSRTNVVEHIHNIFDEGELGEAATCRDFRQVRTEGVRTVERTIPHYNLDVIISVGYRVKSAVATRFRIWATNRLREYLLQGAAINQERLEQLGSVVRILARSADEMVSGVADVLAGYLPGLQLLRDYDAGQLDAVVGSMPGWTLTIEEARSVIGEVRAEFTEDNLFGQERGDALEGVIASIYQGFAGQELYPTVQLKAANLLYLVVKDHPLSDGNKRSAAALFVTFLSRNGILLDADGQPRISNNALAAITLLVAMSDPKEKELMVALVVRMLSEPAQ